MIGPMRRKDFCTQFCNHQSCENYINNPICYIYTYILIKAHVKCIHLNPTNIHVVDMCTFQLPSHLSPLDSEALFLVEMNTKFGHILMYQINRSRFLMWDKGIVGEIGNRCCGQLGTRSSPLMIMVRLGHGAVH